MFVYLANKSNSSPNLDSTTKWAKLKQNNVLANKLTSMRFDLSIYNIICFYVYKHTNIFIYTWYCIIYICNQVHTILNIIYNLSLM